MVHSSRYLIALVACYFLGLVAALEEKKKVIAIASIPFPGHAKPLHRIGRELARRGHDVRVLMMQRGGHTKAFENDPFIKFIPLGDYEKDVCDEVRAVIQLAPCIIAI
jgi:hypothetical protein